MRSVHRFAPSGVLGKAGHFAFGILVFAACSASPSASGTPSTASQPVEPSDVGGPVTPCPGNFAHPNVCCAQGQGEETACWIHPDAPFVQCAAEATTYPDPRRCCPLDQNGSCMDPPRVSFDGGMGNGTSIGKCMLPCPVGWFTPPGPVGPEGKTEANVCCQVTPEGKVCRGFGHGAGFIVRTNRGDGAGGRVIMRIDERGNRVIVRHDDAGGPIIVGERDGGRIDPDECAIGTGIPIGPGMPPGPGMSTGPGIPIGDPPPPPPVPPVCEPCPPGWQQPADKPFVCCLERPDGVACFSRGVPPPPPMPPFGGGRCDAGPIVIGK